MDELKKLDEHTYYSCEKCDSVQMRIKDGEDASLSPCKVAECTHCGNEHVL